MTNRPYFALLATGLGVGLLSLWQHQPAAGSAQPVNALHPAASGPTFTPGLDDLMTMLVQPRHIRLYQAGRHANWELAAYELAELHSAFARVTQALPKYQGVDVQEAVTSIMEPKLAAVAKAISTGDSKGFLGAYRNLTTACSACHTYLEHPFLVISVPGSPSTIPYGDQDFAPPR